MITWLDYGLSIWLAIFLLLTSTAISLIFLGASWLLFRTIGLSVRTRKIVLGSFQIALPLGLVGIVAGFLTGTSRAPAVGAAIPAILTFLGLVVIYLLGKGSLRALSAGFAVFVFSFELLVGVGIGTASRDRHEELIASISYQRSLAEREFVIRRYRIGLGLPPEVSCPKADSNTDKP